MTEQEFNEIKSLIIGLGGITEFKSTADRVDNALSILDRNKQLLLCGVSNRRELLRAYEKFTDPEQNMEDAEQNISWFLGE